MNALPLLAALVTLAWTPNEEPDLAGYRLHRGQASRAYTASVDVGQATLVSVPIPGGFTNFVAVTALDTSGNESRPSNELEIFRAAEVQTNTVELLVNGVTVYRSGSAPTNEPPPVDPPIIRLKVLALVDRQTLARHEATLTTWANQVIAEGRFYLELAQCDRVESYDSSNRLASLRANYERIELLKPDLVLCVGAVAKGGSGWEQFDGHGPGVSWSSLCYSGCMDLDEQTDTNDFGASTRVSAYWSNRPSDGRWDKGCTRPWTRPVAAIDFEAPYTSATMRYGSNFGTNFLGALVWPPRTPDELYEAYFARNLAYRKGEWQPHREVRVLGELFKLPYRVAIEAAASTNYSYAYDTFARLVPVPSSVFTFHSFEPILWPYFATSPTNFNQTVVAIQYKSFGMDRFHPMSHHYLTERIALVSLWTYAPSLIPHWLPVGDTVFDMVQSNAKDRIPPAWSAIYGDLTLPLKP